jgi:hypothetical protein
MVQLISQKSAIRTTVYSDADGHYEFPKLESGVRGLSSSRSEPDLVFGCSANKIISYPSLSTDVERYSTIGLNIRPIGFPTGSPSRI